MPEPRRTFGPVVLVGVASAGLAAVAGNRDWASSPASTTALVVGDTSAKAPLAGALALVVLACWGVLLVTRGVVRRGVAVLAAVAALGVLATVVLGYGAAADGLRDSLQQPDADVSRTGWWWVCLVASVIAVVPAVAAVRWVPTWPAMGTRYDAPGATPPPSEETDLDLWRAMDEGRDPTLPSERRSDP
ncbi:MAG: Trp biosynthesis-associated membrane protein [Nocardioides sp.]